VFQGFSRHEARLALRVSGNRVPAAVRHAQQMLEIKAEREKAEMERRKKRYFKVLVQTQISFCPILKKLFVVEGSNEVVPLL